MLANARKDHSSPLQNTTLPQPSLLMVYYMNKKSFLLGLQFDFYCMLQFIFFLIKILFSFFSNSSYISTPKDKAKPNWNQGKIKSQRMN